MGMSGKSVSANKDDALEPNPELARAIVEEVPSRRKDLVDPYQLALMLLLGNRSLSVKDIGEALGLSQATTSDLITAAKKVGRVKTYSSRKDRRIKMVELTARGSRERKRRRKDKGTTDEPSTEHDESDDTDDFSSE